LMSNPLVADYDVAAPMLDDILNVNREYLPRFFPDA
jgi:6-phospho-beta-glucosidase